MKKRVADKAIFIALTSMLLLVLCLAPAVQVAGDSNKRVGASSTLESPRFPSRANLLSVQQAPLPAPTVVPSMVLFSGSNQLMPLGEIVRKAKASVKDADIRRSWILLSDPTVRIK